MNLSRLMNNLNDDSKYRFHLAKTEPDTRGTGIGFLRVDLISARQGARRIGDG